MHVACQRPHSGVSYVQVVRCSVLATAHKLPPSDRHLPQMQLQPRRVVVAQSLGIRECTAYRAGWIKLRDRLWEYPIDGPFVGQRSDKAQVYRVLQTGISFLTICVALAVP